MLLPMVETKRNMCEHIPMNSLDAYMKMGQIAFYPLHWWVPQKPLLSFLGKFNTLKWDSKVYEIVTYNLNELIVSLESLKY